MAKLEVVAGATTISVNVFIQDSSSTVGAGLSGLVFNSANLIAYYTFAGTNTTAVAISLTTLGAVNSAYASGGFREISATNMKGLYRLDIPNAALAAASGRTTTIMLSGATNMAPCVLEIELTGFDNQSVTDGGLSKLTSLTYTVANQVDANVKDWAGSAVSAVAAGIPDINVKNINNVAATNVTTINAIQGTTQPINFTGTLANALAKVDVTDIAAAAVSTASAQLGVNVVNINAVAATNVTTINAIQGTTQPINFTGTLSNALAKVDVTDIAAAAVSTSTAQLGVNVVNINAVAATAVTTINAIQGTTQALTFDANSLLKVDTEDWKGGVVPAVNVTGVPIVDLKYTVGTISPAVGGSVRADSVSGSVGSVIGATTVGVNNDKAGYSLAAGQLVVKKNTLLSAFPFVMTDSTTHAPKTGVTVSGTRSIDGGAFAATSNTAVEVSSGWYKIDLGATDLNGNTIALRFTGLNADDRNFTILTQP